MDPVRGWMVRGDNSRAPLASGSGDLQSVTIGRRLGAKYRVPGGAHRANRSGGCRKRRDDRETTGWHGVLQVHEGVAQQA